MSVGAHDSTVDYGHRSRVADPHLVSRKKALAVAFVHNCEHKPRALNVTLHFPHGVRTTLLQGDAFFVCRLCGK